MDEFDPEEVDDSRYLVCSHFIACHTLWYDNINTDSGFSLGRVIVHFRPGDGSGFPLRVFRMFVYAQLHGTPDDYVMRVRQVQIEVIEDEERETELRLFGPWEVAVPDDNYVECFGWPLNNVFVPEAGGLRIPVVGRRFR